MHMIIGGGFGEISCMDEVVVIKKKNYNYWDM